ncbi:MAG: hypothetical protein M3N23_02640 [Pseudomonadota bacterium]|nr:hypothetical protein [Pseudomonadota bacterium]
MQFILALIKKIFAPSTGSSAGRGESHCGYAGLCSPVSHRDASRDH